ncbi:AI-2E family transporter [Pseudonocardia nematodicida]|uniref:AI-2E family transporter n=1 Tax=Pseudonocardia nematodicida TaxID=1206997 RepID=A0ABV1KHF5_9PSEU
MPVPKPTREQVIEQGASGLARWSARFLLIAAALAVIGLVVGQLWSIILPVLLGLLIASVFEPLVTWLRAHRWPSILATTAVFLLALVVLAGVIAGIVPAVATQGPQLASGATGGIQQIQAWLAGPPFNLGATQIGQAVQQATERLEQNAASIVDGVVTGLSAVTSGMVTLVVAVVIAFLFVKDGPRFLPWLSRASGPSAGEHLIAVGGRAWSRLGGFIRFQALIGFMDAVLIGIGLAVLGVPLALPLAVLIFFGAFVPIVGALVTGALAVLVALVAQNLTTALIVLALILVVQQLEGNVLSPMIQGKGLGLNSAIVILAVTAGASLFGVAGAFLAVPVVAVVADVLRYIGEDIDRRTGFVDATVADPEEDPAVVDEQAPDEGEPAAVEERNGATPRRTGGSAGLPRPH